MLAESMSKCRLVFLKLDFKCFKEIGISEVFFLLITLWTLRFVLHPAVYQTSDWETLILDVDIIILMWNKLYI